jgi:hypothetical protein
MKTTILSSLLALTLITAHAETLPHERPDNLPQSLAERAEWKETLLEETESSKEHQPSASRYYNAVTTSHPGVLYYPVAVTTNGDEVTLMDGSVWQIRSYDRDQTRGWFATDEIIILPNTSFFSFYDYKLLNTITGAEVEANMLLSPILGTAYTRQILGFNDTYNYVYLTDGSVWSTSPSDYYLYKKWMVGDIVMIGANLGWDSYERPNILLNATYRTYIRANCIQ